MTVEDMQPGRELDALVSEALGISESEWDPPCYWHHRLDGGEKDSISGWMGWCYTCKKLIKEVAGEPRRYSTENSVAIDALEKMWVEGHRGYVINRRADPNCGPDFYWVSIYHVGENPNLSDYEAESSTLAHAASLAILKVIAATDHKP